MPIIIFIFIVFFTMSSSGLVSSEETPKPQQTIPGFGSAGDGADKKFDGFNLQGYAQDGQKAWDVNGDTADIQGTAIKLTNVVANAYGDQKVNVTAATGTIDQTNGKMELRKDVIVTSERGTQLVTESLNWDRGKDEVSTQDTVLLTDQGLTATGKGMSAHPGLKDAKIDQDVTVRVNTEPKKAAAGKFVTVTCDGPMTMNQTDSIATFRDNVVAVQENQTLKADRMEIYFDQKQKQIKEVVCIGNVVIVQGENQTFADRAVYKAQEGKVVLSGRPKLIMLTEGNNGFAAFGDKKSN